MSYGEPDGRGSSSHSQQPRWVLEIGNVDGSRPRILNETIVGPNCSGGNPTAFMRVVDGNDSPPPPPPPSPVLSKRRRESVSLSDPNSATGNKRVKTKYGCYQLSVNNEFSISSAVQEDELEKSNSGSTTTSTSTIVNDGSSQKSSIKSVLVNRPRPTQGLDYSILGIGGWAVLRVPVPVDDEGYVSGSS